jgi:glycine/D-amino acid oxidase-like deaminating enzyme
MRDVIVIGGGIIGCSAAAMLAEEGLRVTLVEATAIGAGASGRNLGAVQHPYDPVLEPLFDASVAAYATLPGLDFPPQPAGLLLLSTDAAGLRERADALRASLPRLDPTFHQRADLIEPCLGPDVSAIRLETAYPIPPHAATAAWAARATRDGVELRIGAAAALRGTAVELASGERLEGDAILVAAGPWTPAIVDPSGAWQPIRRTWGVTLALDLPLTAGHVMEEAEIDDAIAGGAVRWSVPGERQALFSLAVAGGGATLGSTFFPDEPDPVDAVPLLLQRGERFMPRIATATVRELRVCARPQSVDGRPLIGPIPGRDGLFVCAGHGPWGISTGPASARLVVDAMLATGAASIPPELSSLRFGGDAQRTPAIGSGPGPSPTAG